MLGRTSHPNLTRRVIAYYLVFGLATLTSLAVGAIIAAEAVPGAAAGPSPSVWVSLFLAARRAPAAILVPLLLLILATALLWRTVRPLAAIESQLERAATTPALSKDDLQSIQGPTPVETGWNRLVASFSNGSQHKSLDGRLGKALQRHRQQKSEQILNSLTDGVAVTDEDGRIAFANKSLISLLGMGSSAETLAGKTLESCLALEADKAPHSQLLQAKLRGRTVVAEVPCPSETSQGTLRVARSPLHSAGGNTAGGFVWSVRDVTQQKLAYQMRDQFVNAATHELRTPMANIKAYAEMLALGEVVDVEQQKAFCNTINEEVTRLARFVDDLLHLSRMEVGATSLKQQETDMERLLGEVAKKANPQMEQKNITFDMDLPGKLPELVVDKDKLTVALLNLLGNAAKYTPEDGRVRLHVEVADEAVRINVEDTGIGISVEEIPKVLDKFFRSSDPRVHDQTGSGLGLSLSNEIVRLHGGKLSVHSELNRGSKFTITLPMSRE